MINNFEEKIIASTLAYFNFEKYDEFNEKVLQEVFQSEIIAKMNVRDKYMEYMKFVYSPSYIDKNSGTKIIKYKSRYIEVKENKKEQTLSDRIGSIGDITNTQPADIKDNIKSSTITQQMYKFITSHKLLEMISPEIHSNNMIQILAFENKKTKKQLVSVRGTSTKFGANDIYQDLLMGLAVDKPKMFEEAETFIQAYIEKYKPKILNITGHSLGGSISEYLNFYIDKLLPDQKTSVTTFNSYNISRLLKKLNFNPSAYIKKNVKAYSMSDFEGNHEVLTDMSKINNSVGISSNTIDIYSFQEEFNEIEEHSNVSINISLFVYKYLSQITGEEEITELNKLIKHIGKKKILYILKEINDKKLNYLINSKEEFINLNDTLIKENSLNNEKEKNIITKEEEVSLGELLEELYSIKNIEKKHSFVDKQKEKVIKKCIDFFKKYIAKKIIPMSDDKMAKKILHQIVCILSNRVEKKANKRKGIKHAFGS
jgi:hypothetical protein